MKIPDHRKSYVRTKDGGEFYARYLRTVTRARILEQINRLPHHELLNGVQRGRFVMSPREFEVATFIGRGYARKAIAADLGLSLKSVEEYIRRAKVKINVPDDIALTHFLIAYKLIPIMAFRSAKVDHRRVKV